jgi:hypothetical protein
MVAVLWGVPFGRGACSVWLYCRIILPHSFVSHDQPRTGCQACQQGSPGVTQTRSEVSSVLGSGGAFGASGLFYVVGGIDRGSYASGVDCFDPRANCWSTIASDPLGQDIGVVYAWSPSGSTAP